MTAKTNTASIQDKLNQTKQDMIAMGKKAAEVSKKSFDENWKLGEKLQDQAFSLVEKQLDLFRVQMDFLLDNQKEVLELVKRQTRSVEELARKNIDEAVERIENSVDQN